MKLPWTRAIRFIAADGRVLRGEPILSNPSVDIGKLTDKDQLKAKVIVGDDLYDESGKTSVSEEVVAVKKLLGPFAQADVPIIRCIGLNYLRHNAKNVPVESALDYVAGYTCGNDISSRKHQRDPQFAGKIPQWGFSKGFDGYAPFGPSIVSTSVTGDPKNLHLKTIVDGEVRQDTPLDDLLFDCAYMVSYLSSGTTLQKGSIIMTGTPGGVGASFTPPKYLVPGTLMEVSITGIGTLKNHVEFA